MLSITINVLSSQSPTMIPIVPKNCSAQHELFIGLILQYHYVGLDKITMNVSNVATTRTEERPNTTGTVENPPNTTKATVDNTIDDAVFEEDDEHTRQITGGHQASMMSVENPFL